MADTSSLIVVVEDDDRVRASLSALLRAAGHRETALGSAEELLAHGMPNGAVCLVADIRLPGLDGVALVEELRRRGDRTPVVMVTGHGDIPLAVRAVRAGASDFVEKPYDDEQLLASIGQAVADGVAETAAAQRTAQASTRVATLSARGPGGTGGGQDDQADCARARSERTDGRRPPWQPDGPAWRPHALCGDAHRFRRWVGALSGPAVCPE